MSQRKQKRPKKDIFRQKKSERSLFLDPYKEPVRRRTKTMVQSARRTIGGSESIFKNG